MILVIEDNAEVAALFAEAIEQAGYTAVIAPTAADALSRLAIGGYRLAFVDLSLPDMNGAELAIEARRLLGRLPPMVCVTGAEHSADPAKIAAAGFAELITKPIRLSVLTETVQRYAGAAPEE